jgi:hypothetical protein
LSQLYVVDFVESTLSWGLPSMKRIILKNDPLKVTGVFRISKYGLSRLKNKKTTAIDGFAAAVMN